MEKVKLQFFLISLISILFIHLKAAVLTIEKVRLDYRNAVENESVAKQLLEELQHSGNQNVLFMGYQAATEALMAKHAFMPTSKYSWCKKAMSHFEQAIAAAPENLEIRYLRLAVEVNLPSILGMSDDIPADKQQIIRLLPRSENTGLNKEVIKFLLDRKLCTSYEEETIKRINK